uniref:Uncharacterized protein n=1 Tax=Physcomitrium patens TaxID=3218 RepID=A0A2K1K6N4_PHYPA|nr:hypothetical protein PHYPA_011324 [Physcomitrium patens]
MFTRRLDIVTDRLFIENQAHVHLGETGKVVVVTGGASGIGEATARLFAKNGAYVVIADINTEGGSQLSSELGSQAQFVHCDVRKERDVASLVDEAVRWKGKLDVYFSNAGFVGALGSIDELNLDDFDETLAVNLRGAVVGIKHATRVMKPVKSGAIVCTGSTASQMGGLGPHTYCVSKTALKGLVRSTALELRSYGIRVNMVSPDATATPMFQRVMEDSTVMKRGTLVAIIFSSMRPGLWVCLYRLVSVTGLRDTLQY